MKANPSRQSRPGVVVRAWSVCNALGRSRAEFRAALLAGTHGLRPHRALPEAPRELGFDAYLGSTGLWPARHGVPAERDTRQLRLAYAALSELLETLQTTRDRVGPSRVGLVLGTSTGGLLSSELCYPELTEAKARPDWYSCRDGHAFDAAPRQLAEELLIEGPVAVVSTACSSGGKALACARRWLDNGVCDAVLAGGVDSLCLLTVLGFKSLGVLAAEPSKPFNQESLGMNVAEGAAWLLLERGDAGLLLSGSGESSDAHHLVTPHPNANGARRAIELALADAKLNAADIDYVNAHATGTTANDGPEGRLLLDLFPHRTPHASKAMHGHQLGATAATEAVVCLEVLDGLNLASSRLPSRKALSNNLGFGGSNVCLIFERREPVEAKLRSANQLGATPPEVEITAIQAWAPELPTDFVAGLLPTTDGVPPASLLPLRERGRAGLLTRMFASVLEGLVPSAALSRMPIVYGSAFGPASTTLELLEQQQRGECSPLRFSASVHNAPAGVISIALQNTQFSTSMAAGERTVACALLEAMCWLGSHPEDDTVLVVVGDEMPPRPLLDEDYCPLAVGFALRRTGERPASPALGRVTWHAARNAESSRPFAATNLDSSLQRTWANPSSAALDVAWLLGVNGRGALQLPLNGTGPNGPWLHIVKGSR